MRKSVLIGVTLFFLATSSAFAGPEGDPEKKAVCDVELNQNLDLCFVTFGGLSDNYWSCVGNSTSEYGMCLFAAGYREQVHQDQVDP